MTEDKKDDEIVVRLTLRKHVGERLRRMCHAKDMTASHLVDRWIFAHDDKGDPKTPPAPPGPPSLFESIFGKDGLGGKR